MWFVLIDTENSNGPILYGPFVSEQDAGVFADLAAARRPDSDITVLPAVSPADFS